MSVDSVNNRNKVSKPIAITAGIVGAAGGGMYASRHANIDITKLYNPDTYKEMADCFDLKETENALKNNSITKEEYDLVKNLHDNVVKVINKETELNEFFKNPTTKNRLSVNYKEVVKENSQDTMALFNSNWRFPTETADKVAKLKLVNYEKFDKNSQIMLGKWKAVTSKIFKHMALGSLCGAALGVAFGVGLSKLINMNKKES